MVNSDDSISLEVMRRVDIDDVILKFCNDTPCDGLIPDQYSSSVYNFVPCTRKGTSLKQITTDELYH